MIGNGGHFTVSRDKHHHHTYIILIRAWTINQTIFIYSILCYSTLHSCTEQSRIMNSRMINKIIYNKNVFIQHINTHAKIIAFTSTQLIWSMHSMPVRNNLIVLNRILVVLYGSCIALSILAVILVRYRSIWGRNIICIQLVLIIQFSLRTLCICAYLVL